LKVIVRNKLLEEEEDMTEEQEERAKELVEVLYDGLNHPSSSGAIWTKYPTDCAQNMADVAKELRELLGCAVRQEDKAA
jgi:hypothetical protein